MPRRSVFEIPVRCVAPECGWSGTVGEAVPDVDGDGSMGCPKCGRIVKES